MRLRFVSRLLMTLATGGMLLPPTHTTAAEPAVSPALTKSALAIEDVALGQGDTLQGVVLDENGSPIANAEVALSQLGRQVAVARTDDSGKFGFQGLRGGLHLVRSGESAQLLRLWTPGTAPPHARNVVALSEQVTVRGQRPFRDLVTSNTAIIVGVVAAAIVIPIAVHDARKEKSGS